MTGQERSSRSVGRLIPLGAGTHLSYMPALDGIRAVSILGIMANHGGFSWAAGGVISVNVFFVLSGFLITLLLLKEWDLSSTIRLSNFWARRARRLLPALFVLLGGVGGYALLFAPGGTQSQIRGDGLATLFYFSNWHEIASGESYFVQVSALSPLLHTWTLAIEEQFYLVWPLVVLGVLKVWRSPRVLLIITVVAVVASAIEMAVLFHPSTDPSRIYYGTDTRAQDILTGAAAGILLSGHGAASGKWAKSCFSWLAVVAGGVFALEWSRINASPNFTYRFGFLLADVMVSLVIVGVVKAPNGVPARILSFGPLTFVGRISYGLYLWHWPIFLVVNHARTGLDDYSLFTLRLGVTFVVATLSWYLVETPIRQRTFTSWHSWSLVPLGAVTVVAVLFLTTSTSNSNPLTGKVGTEALLGYEDGGLPPYGQQVSGLPKSKSPNGVLFVGDSLSFTVGFWLDQHASRYGLVMQGRPLDGCGLATVNPYNLHGTPSYPQLNCSRWPTIWRKDVRQLDPAVVVLLVGWWETMDRMLDGRWQHLGDAAFDKYETGQFRKAVAVLGSEGAHVVLATAPYFDSGEQLDGQPWDEDSPERVNILNRIIVDVAAEDPDGISVIPLNKYLDPQGHFTSKVGGLVVRFPDGVHTTEAAGGYLAPKVLPQIKALATELSQALHAAI